MHQPKNFIGTRLKRYMEMWHKGTGTGTELQDLIGKQIGFDARNAITFYTLNLVQGTQQV